MRRSRRRAGRVQSRRRFLAGAAGITAVAVLAIGVHLMQRKQRAVFEGADAKILNSGTQENLLLQETTGGTVRETAVKRASIRVENTLITGLSKEEAKQTLKKQYSGILHIQNGDETAALENPVDKEIERLVNQASEMPDVDQDLKFDRQRIMSDVKEQVAGLALKWNRLPVDSVVVSYDKDTAIYEYSKERSGRQLQQEDLANKIMERLDGRSYQEPVDASFEFIPPKRTQAQAKEQYKVIGTFTTKLTSNENRNKNVTLAAEAIDGKVLGPGEEFSFNETTGNRTSEKGYQPAGAYRNGVLIEEPGGGVCQVSTTLYHSIIQSGFKTTERNAHSFAPSYVEKGQDAMVSFDGYAGPDLKFINTSNTPVVLRASVKGLELKMSIVGLPVLEEGLKISIRSEKVLDLEQPEPSYEENPELPFGTEKVIEEGQTGSVWKSYRVVTKDGEVVEETPLHNSSYKSKIKQVQRNLTAPALPSVHEIQDSVTDQQNAVLPQEEAVEAAPGEAVDGKAAAVEMAPGETVAGETGAVEAAPGEAVDGKVGAVEAAPGETEA